TRVGRAPPVRTADDTPARPGGPPGGSRSTNRPYGVPHSGPAVAQSSEMLPSELKSGASASYGSRAFRLPSRSRYILSCRISCMTIDIRSPPLTSTSGFAPVFRATIRFWIRVDSLNRPPTLLTIPSSFRSSSIGSPRKQTGDDRAQLAGRLVQVLVNDLIVKLRGGGEFPPGRLQPAADGRLVFAPAVAEPPLQFLQGRIEKDRRVVGALTPYLLGPLHVDVEDHAPPCGQVWLDF